MRKSKKFINMPVISLEDSLQIGFVKELVVNPAKVEITGLILEQKGWFKEQKIVPYNKVRSIGGDAITIEKSSNVEKPANLPEIINLMKEKTIIVGSRVVTEKGAFLGHADEYYIDETNGKIKAIEITGTFIDSVLKGRAILDIKYIRTIGKDLLIAQACAQDYLEKSDGGLTDTINSLKETTTHLWGNTLEKTKVLGKNIKDYTKRSGLSGKRDDNSITNDEPIAKEILPVSPEQTSGCEIEEETAKEIETKENVSK